MNYISAIQFKAYNPEVDVSTYTDTTISGMITRASAEIDAFLGYSLLRESVTEKLDGMVDFDNNLVIITRRQPIHSVSAVSIVKGTYSGDLDLVDGAGNAKYDIPAGGDRIVFPGQDITMATASVIEWGALRSTNFFINVTYNAGYYGYEIPNDIQDACQLWVMDIISRKQNSSGATQLRQGGISMTFSQRSGESDLIKDAKAILNEYRRVTPV